MNAVAPKMLHQPILVLVIAADPKRLAALTRIIGDLGYPIVLPGQESIVLADGVEPRGRAPAIVFGGDDEQHAGHLPANSSPAQIDAALRAVAAGLRISGAIQSARTFAPLREGHAVLLTPREAEVLHAVANGLANKEIARELGISLHTVKFHLESLMRKLGVSSRTEAVTKALRLHLLESLRV
jgi:DNA-binding NarL/FixJ family response regulator